MNSIHRNENFVHTYTCIILAVYLCKSFNVWNAKNPSENLHEIDIVGGLIYGKEDSIRRNQRTLF